MIQRGYLESINIAPSGSGQANHGDLPQLAQHCSFAREGKENPKVLVWLTANGLDT